MFEKKDDELSTDLLNLVSCCFFLPTMHMAMKAYSTPGVMDKQVKFLPTFNNVWKC